MDDNGNLTLLEAQFLYGLLWNNGCVSEEMVNIERQAIELICPSWDDNAIDPDGKQGSCTKLHRHKICVALALAARGENIINIAPAKQVAIEIEHRQAELVQLLEQKKQLVQEIKSQQQLKQQLDVAIAKLNK